jgi:hypothetical protein
LSRNESIFGAKLTEILPIRAVNLLVNEPADMTPIVRA